MQRSLTVAIDGDVSGLDRATAQGLRDLGNLARGSVQAGATMGSGMERGAARASAAMNRTSSAANGAAQLVIKAFAVDKVLAFGQAITSTSGKFEKYNAILRNALGSQAGASSSLNTLTNFAADTPNQLDELTGSFIKFVNRGLIPSKQQLTNFGDLAASQGKGFDQLTEAILDAQTGEFERLKEFGVRASKSGDQVTLSFKGVTQTVKATSGNITEAIQKFGQLNGVAGSMAAISQTLEGQESNLADTYDRLLVALGNSGVGGAYKFALGAASSFLGVMTSLISNSPAEELRRQQSEINGLVGAIALANDNEQVRLSLIQQLNQQYPEFLGRLGAEAATADLLTRRLAAVNAQYEKKILLAYNEEKIKKAQDAVTASVRQQADALELLSKASGKSEAELQKLDPKGRAALASQIAKSQQFVKTPMGTVPVFNRLTALPNDLIQGADRQKKAQAELNKLTADNAVQRAELTKTEVDGYQKEIAQIKEKIRLKKGNKAENQAEITRLQGLINTAKGIAPKLDMTPIGSGSKPKKAKAAKVAEGPFGDEASLNRLEGWLESQIQVAGGKGVDEFVQQLKSVREQILTIQALTSKNKPVEITGIAEINRPGLNERAAKIVDDFGKIARISPYLFKDTGIEKMRSEMEKGAPTLEFYENSIKQIEERIAELAKAGHAAPPELKAMLASLKKDVQEARSVANLASLQATPGADAADDAKWLAKAQKKIADMKAAGKQVNQTAEEMARDMKSAHDTVLMAAANVMEGVGEGIGRGIGEGFQKAESPLKTALRTILNLLADFMIKIGTAMLIGGTLLASAQAAVPFLEPVMKALGLDGPSAAIAGGALIVGGGIVKGISATALEGGALATKPMYALIGESPKARAGGGELVTSVAQGTNLIAKGLMNMGAVQAATPSTGRLTPNVGSEGMNINLDGQFKLDAQDLVLSIKRYIKNAYGPGYGPSDKFWRGR